ncbi:MAG: hypothetical protein GY823_07605 [Flavobacteriaceae bacterium]|nr:hypothetical protein [Flavobacteriaceae bacterium]
MNKDYEFSGVEFVLAILEYLSPVLIIAIPIVIFILLFRLFKRTNFLKNIGYLVLTFIAFIFVISILFALTDIFLLD